MADPRSRLPLVAPKDELRGHAPAELERLARTASRHDAAHVGLVAIGHALVTTTLARTMPPSAAQLLASGLDVVRTFLEQPLARPALGRAARDARASCQAAVPELQTRTLRAVAAAPASGRAELAPALAEHASHTVARFLGLSVHHATLGLCHLLTGLDEPVEALDVPSDCSGALSYGRVALGSARHAPFQAAVLEQVDWELSLARPGTGGLTRDALALQVFHEFLGVRWRAHADDARHEVAAFVDWALCGS